MKKIVLTKSEYNYFSSNNYGFCLDCKNFVNIGQVEPDAIGYFCANCCNDNVVGIYEAIIIGEVVVKNG